MKALSDNEKKIENKLDAFSFESPLSFESQPQDNGEKFSFNHDAITDLSTSDQVLFQSYCSGTLQPATHTNLLDAFIHQVKQHPHTTAAVFGQQKITYEYLHAQSDRIALKLQEKGIKAGDNVGLFLERSISMLIGILAIVKTGAAYVPQDARIAPTAQLHHICKSADLSLVLSQQSCIDKLSDLGTTVLCIDTMLAGIVDSEQDVATDYCKHPSDLCFVLYTSGTTGVPNGVQVTHKNLCNILLTAPGNLDISQGKKVGQILNIAFDMAAWEIWGCLANGGSLYIRHNGIQDAANQVNHLIATPSILQNIDLSQCKQIQVAAVAGEPCPLPLAEKWAAVCRFYNSCGPTETTIVNTMKHYGQSDNKITIGKPTPNNTVYVLDDNLQPCPIGEVGEMWAGGDCVTSGYINNKTLTRDRYRPDPFLGGNAMMFRTRDLGRWNEMGELEHLGRTDHQVKIKGFRVELDAVSSAIENSEHCQKATTIKFNNQLLAFATPETLDLDELRTHLTKKLPYYSLPETIILLDRFPMTDRGKVDRNQLQTLARQQLRCSEDA